MNEEKQLTEEEQLGKLNFDTYLQMYYRKDMFLSWGHLLPHEREAWIAAAKAVAERVIAEMRTAEAQSE